MKRVGYVIEEIVEQRNLEDAFDYKVRGHIAKTDRGLWLIEHKDEVLDKIRQEIITATWVPGKYRQREINERGKIRTIQSVSLVKAIALNAIMRVVEKYLDKSFIYSTAASIKGRGMLYLFNQVRRDVRKHKNTIVRVDDIKKFYENIPQDLAMECLRRKFKDSRLLTILERCIRMMKKGISIGLRPSQAIANLVLSTILDHRVKDQYGIKRYFRYCDDTRILTESFYESTGQTRILHRLLEREGFSMKPCGQSYDINKRPINFLGYLLFGNGKVMIRKGTKQRFCRKWKRVISIKRKRELIGSFYGITKHADANHLFKKITGISMNDFSALGFVYMAQDGKKRFDERIYRLSDIQNRQIVVKDFETDIKTKEGDGRYVVQFQCDDDGIGGGKFFTNSEELKMALNYAREKDFLPFRTTIKQKQLGNGKSKYQFT